MKIEELPPFPPPSEGDDNPLYASWLIAALRARLRLAVETLEEARDGFRERPEMFAQVIETLERIIAACKEPTP